MGIIFYDNSQKKKYSRRLNSEKQSCEKFLKRPQEIESEVDKLRKRMTAAADDFWKDTISTFKE